RLLSSAPFSFTNQAINGSNGNSGHNLNASLDYKLGPKNTLSTALLLNIRGGDQETFSNYSELDATQALLAQYQSIRGTDRDGLMVDDTQDFRRTMVPQRHELSAEVRLNRVHDLYRTE